MPSVTDCPKDPASRERQLLEEIRDTLHNSEYFHKPYNDDRLKFWTEYERMARKYDDEFLERHNGNLDVLLIFAGLFSAVNSSFLIDMKSDLKPDPMDTTNHLLKIVIRTMNATAFPGEDLSLSSPVSGLDETILWIQGLGYASLSASLLAAFGAVLCKQWLYHFKTSRFGRGTLEERCQKRQLQVNGMDIWYFEAVSNTLPLILQVSLLLFGISLSGDLWATQHTLAAIIIGTTGLGILFILITSLLAIIYPNCPYELALSSFIKGTLLSICAEQKDADLSLFKVISPSFSKWFNFDKRKSTFYSNMDMLRQKWKDLRNVTNGQQQMHSYRDLLPPPLHFPTVPTSSAMSIRWVIEKSTDPDILALAINMIPKVDWPQEWDITTLAEALMVLYWQYKTAGAGNKNIYQDLEKSILILRYSYPSVAALRKVQYSGNEKVFVHLVFFEPFFDSGDNYPYEYTGLLGEDMDCISGIVWFIARRIWVHHDVAQVSSDVLKELCPVIRHLLERKPTRKATVVEKRCAFLCLIIAARVFGINQPVPSQYDFVQLFASSSELVESIAASNLIKFYIYSFLKMFHVRVPSDNQQPYGIPVWLDTNLKIMALTLWTSCILFFMEIMDTLHIPQTMLMPFLQIAANCIQYPSSPNSNDMVTRKRAYTAASCFLEISMKNGIQPSPLMLDLEESSFFGSFHALLHLNPSAVLVWIDELIKDFKEWSKYKPNHLRNCMILSTFVNFQGQEERYLEFLLWTTHNTPSMPLLGRYAALVGLSNIWPYLQTLHQSQVQHVCQGIQRIMDGKDLHVKSDVRFLQLFACLVESTIWCIGLFENKVSDYVVNLVQRGSSLKKGSKEHYSYFYDQASTYFAYQEHLVKIIQGKDPHDSFFDSVVLPFRWRLLCIPLSQRTEIFIELDRDPSPLHLSLPLSPSESETLERYKARYGELVDVLRATIFITSSREITQDNVFVFEGIFRYVFAIHQTLKKYSRDIELLNSTTELLKKLKARLTRPGLEGLVYQGVEEVSVDNWEAENEVEGIAKFIDGDEPRIF